MIAGPEFGRLLLETTMADTTIGASDDFAPTVPKPQAKINPLMAITVGLPAAYSLIFFIGPLFFLIAISFWKVENFRVTPAFSFDNYIDIAQHLFAQSNYAIAILQSFYVSTTTAAIAVVLCGLFVLALVYTLPPRLPKGDAKPAVQVSRAHMDWRNQGRVSHDRQPFGYAVDGGAQPMTQ